MLETRNQSDQSPVKADQVLDYATALAQRITTGSKRPRAEVEASLAAIYENVGLTPPTFVWCRSPREMAGFIRVLRILMMQQSLKPESDAMAALQKAMKQHQRQPDFKELMSRFDQQFKFSGAQPISIGQNIHSKLTNYLVRNLSSELSDSLDRSCGSNNRILIETSLRQALRQRLSTVKDSIARNNWMQVSKNSSAEATLKEIHSHLYEAIELQNDILPPAKINLFDAWGPWYFYWIAVYGYAQQAPELNFSAGHSTNELQDWMQLLDGALSFQLFENFAFVCEHPRLALFDERGQLHNGSGPAVSFNDGDTYFAWHGCVVPGWIIEQKRFITPAQIDRQSNVEMRRVMIDIYGWERYLKNSRLKKLHEDKFGVLYTKDLGGRPWQSIYVVEVLNATPEPSGKRRRYLLRVPPHMKTAKEAVAWTFGMTEETYNPDFES